MSHVAHVSKLANTRPLFENKDMSAYIVDPVVTMASRPQQRVMK